jgi:arsenate reductase
MELLRIYHNPRCSKSRGACQILAERGIQAEVLEYLKTPPSRAELAGLVKKLGLPAEALVRKGEAVYKEHYAGRTLSEDEWLDALARHPILIERPIAIRGPRAVIARPPEKILELL